MCSARNRGSNSPWSIKILRKIFFINKRLRLQVNLNTLWLLEVPVKGKENAEVSLTSPAQRKKEPDILMQEEVEFLKKCRTSVSLSPAAIQLVVIH